MAFLAFDLAVRNVTAVAGVNINEEDPEDTSVGYGGLPNEEGVVEQEVPRVLDHLRREGAGVVALCLYLLARSEGFSSTTRSVVLGLGLGLPSAAALAFYVNPPMGLLGGGLGLFAAFAWRAARLRRWAGELTRDMQALIAILIIQLDSGGDSLYRALECAVAESNLLHLRPIVERHVLARKAAGVPLDQAKTQSQQIADSLGVDESFCPVRAMLGAFVTGAHFPIPDLLTCSVGATCDDFSAIAQRPNGLGHPILWWEIPHRRAPEPGSRPTHRRFAAKASRTDLAPTPGPKASPSCQRLRRNRT